MTLERVTSWFMRGVGAARQIVVLLCATVLHFVVVLFAMTMLISTTTGWDALIVTSGSMSPTVNAGDILFIDEPGDELIGQQTVIAYERADGELITHRVFATDRSTGTYITKGDANPTPDSDVVARDDVVGVGWLVIPYLGLPVVWYQEGNFLAVGALALLSLIALLTVVFTRRTAKDDVELDERLSKTAQRGIVRVRIVIGLIITMMILAEGQNFRNDAALPADLSLLVGTLVTLIAVTAVARFRSLRASGATARRLALLELAADTVVVVVFVAASGTSSIGWMLMALPIIEAAIHFRLTGAFIHWIVMSGASVGALLWTNGLAGTSRAETITALEQLVDRLGVLLLIVIPASYLAEQLLGDVLAQRKATVRARNRSAIIERVTDAGLDVTRLGVDVFPRLSKAAVDLGFDSADCWTGDGTNWHVLSRVSNTDVALPEPSNPASTLRLTDLAESEVFITGDDPDELSAHALEGAGLGLVARLTLVHRDSMYVVLRVGTTHLGDDPASQVMALRLLAAQAAIALQNEHLLAELKSTHAEIERRAHYDALTDLPNRSFFATVLAKALEGESGDPQMATVMFLDLNGFKAVNDSLGHNVGDELLMRVADRLRAAVNDRGVVARLGGDEFTVLLSGRNADFGEQLAERIHRLVNEPITLSGETVLVGTSIGIAHGEDGITASELMRRADVAMYAAKADGGTNRTGFYRVELDEAERRTALLSRSLLNAIEDDELHLVYQPIIEAGSGAIAGIEATVRWVHPQLGPIPTVEIIDIAESGNSLDQFNKWVLDRATSQIAAIEPVADPRLSAPFGPEPFIAVNVSPAEFQLPTLTHNVESALAASGLRPERLAIELRESVTAETSALMGNADRLQMLGVRLALDNFGEGPTSLTDLHRLPISFLKLDGVFVRNASSSAPDRTMLRSVVALAHELGFFVVAEGVENVEQMEMVKQAGANLVQGYGLFRPMQINELRQLIHSDTGVFEYPAATPSLSVPGGRPVAMPPPQRDTQVVG